MAVSSVELKDFKKLLQEKVLFGNEPTPELLAILTVYFVQGILGLARLAVSFFLKDNIGLTPAEVAALTGISSIPWIIKPVFGFLSDGIPIFGYRRRPYLILSGFLGTLSWLALAFIVDSSLTATIAILITSLSVAISDVIVDSLVVARAREESVGQAGSLQSLCWGFSALGGLITAYLSGWLLEHLSISIVFEITATFPLLVSAVAWLIAEEKISATEKQAETSQSVVSNQITQLWNAVKQKSIWLPALFLFIWQATPNAESAFFFFTTNELGFEPEFLGRVRLVSSLASLAGIFIFQKYLKQVPFRKILGWSTVIAAGLGMTTLLLVTHANRALGIDDRLFSLGDSLILTVMGQITWMPVLVLSARLCPKGVEATLFALLMSIWNLSLLLSNEFGALLTSALGITETNFDRLWLLVIITNLSTLLPLFFIGWLPEKDPQSSEEANVSDTMLSPGEAAPHRLVGSVIESSLMPDLVPEFIINKSSQKDSD
ncbi:Folate-biopterin transporter [Hyella patelloides LEGE 07179]|uniref:Folate-biopterin transporter n=1 Tax=Hyella patelloides LEGE 07179 TaxID=945734 RepID=A0A563VZ55_9CYAN|nr:folate/biopterin family MFS transporter [Hyella patelloides]VEP16742.1 Folate-biopterin transporter [Hyella patelloides LEGE 07179]